MNSNSRQFDTCFSTLFSSKSKLKSLLQNIIRISLSIYQNIIKIEELKSNFSFISSLYLFFELGHYSKHLISISLCEMIIKNDFSYPFLFFLNQELIFSCLLMSISIYFTFFLFFLIKTSYFSLLYNEPQKLQKNDFCSQFRFPKNFSLYSDSLLI